MRTPPANSHGVGIETHAMYGISSMSASWHHNLTIIIHGQSLHMME